MAELKIPQKTLQDNFNLQDFKDDFNALNSEIEENKSLTDSEIAKLKEIANTWEAFKSTGGEIGGDLIASTLKSWGDTMVDGNLWIGNFSREYNGHTKLPNGLIMQWGTIWTGTETGKKNYKITYPIHYPNKILYFNAQTQGATYDYSRIKCVYGENYRSEMNIVEEKEAPYGTIIRWFAIGY